MIGTVTSAALNEVQKKVHFTSLGEIAVAGQFQQRPIPRGGLMFKASWFEAAVREVPANCRYVRHWDLAALKPRTGSSYGQAWNAGVKLGRAPNGVYYIVNVDRLQGDGDAVRRRIKLIAGHSRTSSSHCHRIPGRLVWCRNRT